MDEKNMPKELIIKICCIIAAFILWLYIYNVENPIKDRKITIPVQVTNTESMSQSKLAPIIDDKINVTLTIRGNSTDIYSIDSNDFSAEANLENFALKKGENKVPVDLKKAPSKIKILNKEGLWVKIVVDDIVERSVPIKVQFEGKTKAGYFPLNPELKRSTATISGAAQVVNQVKETVIKCDLKDADKDIDFKGTLVPVNSSGVNIKGIIVEPRTEDVIVPIRKVKSVGINVVFKGNISSNPAIKSILPVNDKIEIAVKEDATDKISKVDTEAVDISKLDGKETWEVKLSLPKDVYLVNTPGSNGTVKLKITYNKIIEKDVSVDVKSINLNNNLDVVLASTKVTITVSGIENTINNLNASDINCFIDLASAVEGDNNVPVVVEVPSGVIKAGVNPANIKVTAKKKILEGKSGN